MGEDVNIRQVVTGTQTITLPTPTNEREYYTFKAWATLSNGGGNTYKAGETISVSTDRDLYAVWEKRELTASIEYMGNYKKNTPLSFSGKLGDNSNYTHVLLVAFTHGGTNGKVNIDDPTCTKGTITYKGHIT